MNRSIAVTYSRQFVPGTVISISKRLMIFAALTLLATVSAPAQNAAFKQKLAAVKQAAAENKVKLHQYQWIETTQLTVKGDQKPSMQNSCQYGPDGQVIRTPLGLPPQQPSGGRLKKRIMEKKEAEMKNYMQAVKGVIGMYIPPDPERMQEAYKAGHVAFNPVPGAVNLIFTNYVKHGDKMTVTFDATAKRITSLNVDTYMGKEKDKVTFKVVMSNLSDGTGYARQTVLNASEKKLTMIVTNSNYQKL